MTTNSTTNRKFDSRSMLVFTLITGIVDLIFQIFPDFDLITFMITTATIGGLVGSSKDFDEREKQLLWQSYSSAFQWLFLVVYFVFTIKVVLQALNLANGAINFLEIHWLGLTVSAMCILLGISGLRNFQVEK